MIVIKILKIMYYDKHPVGCKNGIFITENVLDVFCFMFADDVFCCYDTVMKLQQQLHIVDVFCSETCMEVYMDKLASL